MTELTLRVHTLTYNLMGQDVVVSHHDEETVKKMAVQALGERVNDHVGTCVEKGLTVDLPEPFVASMDFVAIFCAFGIDHNTLIVNSPFSDLLSEVLTLDDQLSVVSSDVTLSLDFVAKGLSNLARVKSAEFNDIPRAVIGNLVSFMDDEESHKIEVSDFARKAV